MERLILLACTFLGWTGCTTTTTISGIQTDSWIVVSSGPTSITYFCLPNKIDGGHAQPACYEANMKQLKRCGYIFGCKNDDGIGVLPESKNEVILPK